LERAEEIVQSGAKVTLRDLAILAGVAIDKSQLLSGEATQRIETIEAASGADDFERQFEELAAADVEEIPAMGLSGGDSPTKGGDGCAVDGDPGADQDGDPGSGGEDPDGQPGGSADA
jgi:hypothetical protein